MDRRNFIRQSTGAIILGLSGCSTRTRRLINEPKLVVESTNLNLSAGDLFKTKIDFSSRQGVYEYQMGITSGGGKLIVRKEDLFGEVLSIHQHDLTVSKKVRDEFQIDQNIIHILVSAGDRGLTGTISGELY